MNSQVLLFAQKIDLNVLNFIPSIRSPLGIKIMTAISNLGSPQSFVLLTIVMALFFWLHKKPHHLIQFLITVGVGSLVVYLIKMFIVRPRPIEALIQASGYSFPSGHATIATLFCSMIIYAYKDHFKNPFLKALFILFFALLALTISFSRVYLSVHYLSDVVVGIIMGLLISSISVFIFENFYKKETLI